MPPHVEAAHVVENAVLHVVVDVVSNVHQHAVMDVVRAVPKDAMPHVPITVLDHVVECVMEDVEAVRDALVAVVAHIQVHLHVTHAMRSAQLVVAVHQ